MLLLDRELIKMVSIFEGVINVYMYLVINMYI